MRRPQFSIAGLAWVILVAAFGLAAIRSGSEAWSGAMFSIMAFAMISSLLGVALPGEPDKFTGWGLPRSGGAICS